MAEPLQVNDEEQTPNDPVVLTQDEIATQAIPTDEQLAQETQKIEDLPTTSSGIPRLTIAPVTPQPKAGVGDTTTRVEVQKQAPFIRTETKELEPKVQEELERKAEVTEPQTYESIMKRLEAGETVTLGNKTYVGRPTARVIKNNAQERVLLKGQIAQYGMPGEVQEDQPTIAFTDPAASSVVLPQDMTDPDERDLATTYAQGRMAVNSMLQQTIPDRNVRQIIVDNYVTGDFFANLQERLAEQGRGFVAGLPLLGVEAYGALEALEDYSMRGIPFMDAWEARRPERERQRQKYLEGLDNVLSGPTLAMHFNNEVNRIAKERFENGTITEEQYNDIAFVEVGGELVPKQHFDEDTAYQLMDLAFNEMPEVAQIGVMLTENAVTGGFFGSSKAAKAEKELKKLKRLIAADKTLQNLPYSQVVQVLKRRDTNFKVNEKLLDIGIGQEKVSDQLKASYAKIQESNSKLEQMALDGLEKTADYKIELSKRDNLIRMRNRAFVSGKTRPYLIAGARDAAVVSIGQFYARDILGESIDPGAAEAVGFLAMNMGAKDLSIFAGKKLASGATSLLGFTGNTALRVTPDFLGSGVSMFGRVANKVIPLGDTTVNDYERLVFEPLNGRKMNLKERAALRRTVQQVQKLSPENKERFLDDIGRIADLEDIILSTKAFPDEATRMRAHQLFQMSVGQAAGITITAAANAATSINYKQLKKEGLNTLFDGKMVQRDQIEQTKIALEAFAKHIAEFGDINRTAPIRRMLQGMQDMVNKQEVAIQRDFSIINQNLDTFITASAANILEPVDETFITSMRDMKVRLQGVLNETIDEEKALKEANAAWAKGTSQKLDEIEALRRDTLRHRNGLSRLLEQLALGRLEQLTARGDAAYARLNTYINTTDRPPIDIAEAVQDMMNIAGESNIMFMFGRDGLFFTSAVGRKAQLTFNNMAQRAFDSIDPEFKEFLEAKIIEKGIATAEQLQAMNKVDFALLAHSTGAMNIFGNVTLTEADTMRRAFRDYGYKVKNSNPAVGSRFKEFAEKLDNLIESQDEEGFQELLKARDEYAAAVGDTMREGGTFYKLKQSRVGGEKKNLALNAPTTYFYRTFQPTDLFEDVTDGVDRLMRNLNDRKKLDVADDLNRAVAELQQAFGDPVDGNIIFDLTDETVLENFNLIRRAVTESLQDRWFSDYIKAVRSPRVGAKIKPEETYNFQRSTDLEFVNENSQVLVKRLNSKGEVEIVSVPLLDLDSLYKTERLELERLEEGTKLAQGFKGFQTRASTTMTRIKADEALVSMERGQSLETIKILSNSDDGVKFFEKYIAGTGEDISVLKNRFVSIAQQQGKSKAQAEKTFDDGVKALTFQGLLARGGYRANDALDTALDGSEYAGKTFHDSLSLVETLKNPDVQENMLEVFDPEHIEYINAIAAYVHIQSARALVLSGGVRGISTTEALSRAYNIAREMVSPLYVGSEIAIRIMQEMGAETLMMALDSKDAGRIMRNILEFPELVTPQDLKKFDTYLIQFMITHATRTGQEAVVRKYLDIDPFDGDEDGQETEASTSGQ